MAEKSWIRRLTAAFASLGCLGCLGLGGAGVVGIAVGIVVGGLILQSRWEEALHWAIDEPTGGEVDFEGLHLGLGTVTVEGVVVRDPEGVEVLRVDELIVEGEPWSWSTEALPLDRAELAGVHLLLRREGATWALPTTTIALLQGRSPEEVDLPEVALPELLLTDVSAEVRAPEGQLSLHLDAVRVPEVSATLDPGLRAEVGPLTLTGLTLTAPGAETLSLGRVSLETDPLTLEMSTLPLRGVRVEEVSARVPPEGWSLPAQALGALLGGEGLTWPTVTATDVQLSQVALTATGADGGVRVAVREVALPRLELGIGEQASLELEPVEVQGFTLSETQGATLASTPWAKLTVAPWTSEEDRITLSGVVTSKATLHARKGAAYLGLRRSTWNLLRVDGLPWRGARVHRLSVDGATARITAAGGTLDARVGQVEALDLSLDPKQEPPWEVSRVTVRDTTATVGKEEVASLPSLLLEPDGSLTVRGGEVWTQVSRGHTLDLPPVVEDHVPTWLGGLRAEEGGEWFGVDYAGLPWQPRTLEASDLTLHLRDAYVAKPPQDWDVSLSSATVRPRVADRLPLHAHLGVAGGEVEVSGSLRADGSLSLGLTAKKIALTELQAYTRPYLAPSGLRISRGAAAAELGVRVHGSTLTVDGEVHLRRLELQGTHAAGRLLAKAGNQLGNLTVPVEVEGDLSDPKFSPVEALIAGATGGLLDQLRAGASRAASDAASRVLSSSAVSTGRDKVEDVGSKARDVGARAQDKLQDLGSNLGLRREKKQK